MKRCLLVDDLNPFFRVAIVSSHELFSLDADLFARSGLLDSIYYARVLDITSTQVTWELAPDFTAKSAIEKSFPILSKGAYRFVQIVRETFQEEILGQIIIKPAEVTQNLTFVHNTLIFQPLSTGITARSERTIQPDEEKKVVEWYHSLEKAKGLAWPGPNCLERILRDEQPEVLQEILINRPHFVPFVQEACKKYAPYLTSKIRLKPAIASSLLDEYGFEDQWLECLSPLITFDAGAHLIFQPTSVAIMIDVNAGSLLPNKANERLVEKLAQQLVRRRLNGRILIDFAGHLKNSKERESLLNKLKAILQNDRPKWHVLGWSKSGLLELQRERRRMDLHQVIKLRG